jgi:hypothetical protein
MALTELETARLRRLVGHFVESRRPAPHIRPKLDIGYRITGQSVEIFEVRPLFGGPPGAKHEGRVAKATFVRSRNGWRVFWQRSDLRWHGYDPAPEVATIEDFLRLVGRDAYACFWG